MPSSDTITVRLPARLKRAVVATCGRRGYTLTGFVVRALEDALAAGWDAGKRLVGRGEITLYARAPRATARRARNANGGDA